VSRDKEKELNFINEEKKKIIEFFGDYWHSKEITGISYEEEERKRKTHFNNYDYKVLVIWEKELKDIELLKRKIWRFNNE